MDGNDSNSPPNSPGAAKRKSSDATAGQQRAKRNRYISIAW